MRISDWSSDVCSSDLPVRHVAGGDTIEIEDDPRRRQTGGRKTRRERIDHFDLTARGLNRLFGIVALAPGEIGRASCRARVSQYGEILGGAGSLQKQNKIHHDN